MSSPENKVFKVSLLVAVLSFAASLPYLIMTVNDPEQVSTMGFFLDVLSNLLAWVLAAGLLNYLLAIHRGQEANLQQIWDCFGLAGKIVWLQIRILVQTVLWSMLLFIPGLVATYRYRFALYCLLDDPSLSAGEAIRRSGQLTNGKKMELFWLDLSFFGVTALVVGIPAIVAALIGALALETIGEMGLVVLTMAVLVAPMAWLQAYVSLTDIKYYRTAAPDSPAEPGEQEDGGTPWED